MKYLKLYENLFVENKEVVSKFISNYDVRKSEIRKELQALNNEYESIIKTIKSNIAELDEKYLEEIRSYMVDVEDFDQKYKYYPINVTGENICEFKYSFTFEHLHIFEDLILKLTEILSQDAFRFSYHSDMGSVSLASIKRDKIQNIKITIRFKRVRNYSGLG